MLFNWRNTDLWWVTLFPICSGSEVKESELLYPSATVFPEANFTDEFILLSSDRSDVFTSNGLVGLVWSSREVKGKNTRTELINS